MVRPLRHAVAMAPDTRFVNDLQILRVMLELEEQGRLHLMSGEQLIEEAGGRMGAEAERGAFVRELHILREDELIGFELGSLLGRPEPRPNDYEYLQNLRGFRLRTKGRDRARGEVVRLPLLDPDADDGRPIPARIVERFAAAVADELRGAETRTFLADGGLPADQLPDYDEASGEATFVRHVVLALLERGSSGRRSVRDLIGRWLADELEIGPTPERRDELTGALARVGWHVEGGTLVVGERLVRPPASGDPVAPLERIVRICRRFDEVARQLGRPYRDRHVLTVADEHDAQHLLHALLRIDFDDVRAESWNPPYLGGSSRADFLLPEAAIVVEVKMARPSLLDKEMGKQLAEDITRYADPASNRGASTLVCFVYDPGRVLANPRGLEADLERASTERLRVLAVIA